jgi:hypothetical protein
MGKLHVKYPEPRNGAKEDARRQARKGKAPSSHKAQAVGDGPSPFELTVPVLVFHNPNRPTGWS